MVSYADAYLESGHWRNAMLVSAVLAERLPSELDVYQDEDGEPADLRQRTTSLRALREELDALGLG